MKAEKRNFEIEHWPNPFGKHALKRMTKGYIKGWIVFSTAAIIFFTLYYFTHISILGRVAQIAIIGLLISPFLPLISWIQRDKKNPSYGINKDGFLLNERGWNSAFFTWDEIEWIKDFDDPKLGKELHFEFKSITKAMNKPNQKFKQALNREYSMEKQPKRISMQLVKGDTGPFIEKFKTYFNAHKAVNPISKEEAFKKATAYIEKYCYPISLNIENAKRIENHLDFEGFVWLFSMPDSGESVVISEAEEAVLCILSQKQTKKFPHEFDNPMTKHEALDIGRQYLIDNQINGKIINGRGFFYQDGLERIEDPVWVVTAKLPHSNFDGTGNMSLLISVHSRKVEDKLVT